MAEVLEARLREEYEKDDGSLDYRALQQVAGDYGVPTVGFDAETMLEKIIESQLADDGPEQAAAGTVPDSDSEVGAGRDEDKVQFGSTGGTTDASRVGWEFGDGATDMAGGGPGDDENTGDRSDLDPNPPLPGLGDGRASVVTGDRLTESGRYPAHRFGPGNIGWYTGAVRTETGYEVTLDRELNAALTAPVLGDGEAFVAGEDGRVRRIHLESGNVETVIETSGEVVQPPVLGANGEWLYLLEKTGPYTRIRQYDLTAGADAEAGIMLEEEASCPPVIADGRLYVGTDDGGLSVIDTDRMAVETRHALGSPLVGGPAVYDGNVSVPDATGSLLLVSPSASR
jgi:hypothetical protein